MTEPKSSPTSRRRRRFRFLDDTVFGLLLVWLAREDAAVAWVETWPSGERRLAFITARTDSLATFNLGDALVRAGALKDSERP